MALKIKATTQERDLGIILSPDLKWNEQICHAATKASQMLDVLRNTFVSPRKPELWKKLYTIYVRSSLEFAKAVWNPYLKGIDVLERVHGRATKVANTIKMLNFEGICARLRLTALSDRWNGDQIIQQYKIINDLHGRSHARPNYYFYYYLYQIFELLLKAVTRLDV